MGKLSYDQDVERITGIQFSVMSGDEIRARSVAEIKETNTFAGNDPCMFGLFDPRMGVNDRGKTCQTCQMKMDLCVGHFGHIELARPMFHIKFLPIVKEIMHCVCFRCSKLLISKEAPELKRIISKKISRQNRFKAVYKLHSGSKKYRICSVGNSEDNDNNGCGAQQPDKITKNNYGYITLEWASVDGQLAEKDIYMADDVHRILSRITDEDAEVLGFPKHINRPENLIYTVFPVPPPAVRPSVRNDTGQRCHDDLTHNLCEIVKNNNLLATKMANKSIKKESIQSISLSLQIHITHFIDNNNPSIPSGKQRTNGRTLRSITERLKAKEGRVRGNLMGKRVDFSARSVITPDPNISIIELGVPVKIAMNLTFPDRVSDKNYDEMLKLVLNGPDNYPGAKYLRKTADDNRMIRLKNVRSEEIHLDVGDIVDRHMLNGDYVLFNRQPSLHKASMIGHQVRVLPFDTFRLNPAVTPPYNADYDGDEMNLHFPQSVQTMNELKMLAHVTRQIISPRFSSPIISVVQDVTLGIYRLTNESPDYPAPEVTEKQLFNIQMSNSKFVGGHIPKPDQELSIRDNTKDGGGTILEPRWRGRQLISAILPKSINLETKGVSIVNGEVQPMGPNSKPFVKNVYQGMTDGLVHTVYNSLGEEEAKHLYDNTQKLICDWLVYSGFSVGLGDLMIANSIHTKMRKEVKDRVEDVYEIIRQVHKGTYKNTSLSSNNQNFESEIMKLLDKAKEETGKMGLKDIKDDNLMINMVKSGSKGKPLNVTQMVAILGQQNVSGTRVMDGYTNRTLPHYTMFDDGPESRGFVDSSFIGGLTPQQFYFHAMGGRIGLIDTAVKSITRDSELIIIVNNESKRVLIGDWIDSHMDNPLNKDKIKYHDETEANMELLDLSKLGFDIKIPTINNKGESSWGHITNITRHDPSEYIYDVRTQYGRSVKVVNSKTLLIWNEEELEFEEVNTEDVSVGDSVPIMMNLSNDDISENRITHIDMTKYFPKTEYVYGTDYQIARDLIFNTYKGKVPRFWWGKNNGTTFTLPYEHAHRLLRIEKRSNVDAIKSGGIYPYHAKRSKAFIPEKFELNRDNGFFIGIYLADGNLCDKGGLVTISKNDKSIQQKVTSWFDKHDITWQIQERNIDRIMKNGNRITGKSTSIRGHSTILMRFIRQLVGIGSEYKFIPAEFYQAPDEFIIGLMDGYFSGDGSITQSSINASSASEKLVQGISMLLTRFGIFVKRSTSQQKKNNVGTVNIKLMNNICICSKWAVKFANLITLSHHDKNEKLKLITKSKTITKCKNMYKTHNDVFLDPIVSITKILASSNPEYKKVYDVTVPETLNLCLENGLLLNDTAETGYIQRRLIKAMEDCKISYDLTVRNATGGIVQFLYGEDGVDSIKVENHPIPYLEPWEDKSNLTPGSHRPLSKLEEEYLFRRDDLLKNLYIKSVHQKLFKNPQVWEDRCRDHYKQILADREYLITKIFHGAPETSIEYPLGIKRMILNAKNLYHINNKLGPKMGPTDLEPVYILDTLDLLSEQLKMTEYNPANKLLGILLRAQLSPKRLIHHHRLNKLAFDHIVEQIRAEFMACIAHPSEMVGIVSAQSIGEPSTQLVLNSFHSSGSSEAAQSVQGVPRLSELLSVTKNIKGPMTKIYLENGFNQYDPDNENSNENERNNQIAREVQNRLEATYTKDIVISSAIYYDPSDSETTIDDDQEFLKLYKMFEKAQNQVLGEDEASSIQAASPWLLRFEFDRSKMMELGLTMHDVHHAIYRFYHNVLDAQGIHMGMPFSDDNAYKQIMRIRLNPDELKDSSDVVTELKALEQNIMENVMIKGVADINKVIQVPPKKETRYNPETKSFDHFSELMLISKGKNLPVILGMSHVDSKRTISNDLWEVYETLGIEAVRRVLIEEFQNVFSTEKINYRHISLLVDVMTNRGSLLPISRHGINRSDIGPLAKCSFEETADMLVKAGVFGEFDPITGVSANIILGQIPPCGTGDSQILMDQEKIMQIDDLDENKRKQNRIDQGTCTSEALSFNIDMGAMNADAVDEYYDENSDDDIIINLT
jgi:DNA-directed RNA polymerase beta' subunit/intein/homing endonuclease